MEASCGPTSALSHLNKHAQRDNYLQHEAAARQGLLPRAVFRNQPGVDANLNQEFQQFSEGRPMDINGFQGYAPLLTHQQFGAQANQIHTPPGQIAGHQQWMNDFNGLSLNQNTMHNQNSAHAVHKQRTAKTLSSNWSLQFLQHAKQHTLRGQVDPQEFSAGMRQPMLNMVYLQIPLLPPELSQRMEQEHINSKAWDDQFDQVSKKIDAMEQVEAQQDESEKEQFAEAARRVQTVMTSSAPLLPSDTASKFEQSNFLKLMSQISNRELEMSKEGDNFVAKESGQDVRQYLSDPLRDERLELNANEPLSAADIITPSQSEGVITNESVNVRNSLPDPLAHIRDGELLPNLTPLQAARIISGGQVTRQDWFEDESWEVRRPGSRNTMLEKEEQDVYDDYRNDDDFF